jgi:tetratricopeptide (TPR) repeat protein
MATELGLDEVRAHALDNVGVARVGAGDAGGLDDLEQSIEIANEIGSIESLRGYNNLRHIYWVLGILDRAAEAVSAGLEVADRFGASGGTARWLRFQRVHVAYWRGRWDDVLQIVEETRAEAGPVHALLRWGYELRGRIRLARGDDAGAVEDADRSLQLGRQAKDPQTLYPALSFAALAYLSVGREEDARLLADELLASHAAEILNFATAVFDLAWLLVALGRRAELLEAMKRSTLLSRWMDAARVIAQGDYAQAADVYAEMGALPNEAYTRLRVAEQLVAEGQRAEADEQLQKALAFYQSVSATRYIREGEALLAASA